MVFSIWHPPVLSSVRHVAVRLFPGPWTASHALWFILAALLVVFSVVAIHELGHALMGIAVGFRIQWVRVGPLQVNPPLRVSRYRGPGAWLSGRVALLPLKDGQLRLRAIAMVMAGPLANLFSGLVVLLLPFSKGTSAWLFVAVSIGVGIVELLIPHKTPMGISDASRLLMLLRNRLQGERWLAIMKLAAELSEGVPAESMSSAFLAKAIAFRDSSPDTVVAHALAYAAAFWRDANDEAAHLLETCLQFSAHVAPTMRDALISDAAVFQARKRKRVDLAEQWLAALPPSTQIPWLRTRIEAGILEVRGDVKGAIDKLDEVEAKILSTPNSAQREVSLRFLRRWQAELRSV
jgi:peptidase M50-like protein